MGSKNVGFHYLINATIIIINIIIKPIVNKMVITTVYFNFLYTISFNNHIYNKKKENVYKILF